MHVSTIVGKISAGCINVGCMCASVIRVHLTALPVGWIYIHPVWHNGSFIASSNWVV